MGEQCRQKCEQYDNCGAIEWFPSPFWCYIWSNAQTCEVLKYESTSTATIEKYMCVSEGCSYYIKLSMTTECDWNGVDSDGRTHLGGGGHSVEACQKQCTDNTNCKFSALSSDGYCHNFATCKRAGGGTWSVY